MELTDEYYLFLSNYIPLPLSALKIIEKDKNHPLRQIKNLNFNELKSSLEQLNKQPGIVIRNIDDKIQIIQNLLKKDFIENIERYIERWSENGIKILSYFDGVYPERLKVIKDSPKVIFYKGNFDFDYNKAVSIIGTRNPTQYGLTMANKIGKRFAELGFTIVNGFAKGIDRSAIEGALNAGGKVIGVIGSGLLNPYPKENLELFDDIIENKKGVFISEQLPDNSITKSSLATRNRISSALSLGNVIIEAGEGSGTKWQVDYGKIQGKPIIALKPKENVKQAYLPSFILKNEKNCFIISDVNDVDEIAKSIVEFNIISKNGNRNLKIDVQKSLTDF